MGKGDKRTRRGKIWRGSYGVSRLKTSNKPATVQKATETAAKTQ
jgi:30S ribosomal protein S31